VEISLPRWLDTLTSQSRNEGRLEGAAEAEGVVRQAEGTAFLVYLEDGGRRTVGFGTVVEEVS
jgi:hypothetical protein